MDKFTGRLSIQGLYTLAAITRDFPQIQAYIWVNELDVHHANLAEPFTRVEPLLEDVLMDHGNAPDQEVLMLSVWAGIKGGEFAREHLMNIFGDINHYDDNQFFAQGE